MKLLTDITAISSLIAACVLFFIAIVLCCIKYIVYVLPILGIVYLALWGATIIVNRVCKVSISCPSQLLSFWFCSTMYSYKFVRNLVVDYRELLEESSTNMETLTQMINLSKFVLDNNLTTDKIVLEFHQDYVTVIVSDAQYNSINNFMATQPKATRPVIIKKIKVDSRITHC